MNILYSAYSAITGGLFISLLPSFWMYSNITGRHHRHLKERLGIMPPNTVENLTGRPRIWVHAASLGEVNVAASIIEPLRHMVPGCSLIFSTITEHGRELARETFEENIPVIYAPIDFWGSVRKTLTTVCPDIIAFLETEIWPTWLFEAQRMGIKTALINGRISKRSIAGYLKLKPFFRDVLRNFDVFSMILEEDAARIKAMGADPNKIEINGNAKYDLLESTVGLEMEAQIRQILDIEPSKRVFVAGSTRDGEEEMVLGVYDSILKNFPDIILIIAPRHIERTPAIEAMVKGHNLGYQLWSDLEKGNTNRTEQVIIINTFGELIKIYSIGTIIFCGASLVPLGGQNPLEPAIWGKLVFYGPSMEDFSDAKALLEAVGAGMTVSSPAELAKKALWFLSHPEALKKGGERARDVVHKNKGAARKHAEVIARLCRTL